MFESAAYSSGDQNADAPGGRWLAFRSQLCHPLTCDDKPITNLSLSFISVKRDEHRLPHRIAGAGKVRFKVRASNANHVLILGSQKAPGL